MINLIELSIFVDINVCLLCQNMSESDLLCGLNTSGVNNDSDSQLLSQNKYACLSETTMAANDEHDFLEVQTRKRTRVNTDGQSGQNDQIITQSDYENLTMDKKLSVLFSHVNTIGHKVDNCLLLHLKVQELETSLSDHDFRLKLLEYKSVDLEARSRRNNLIFGGISEQQNENCHTRIAHFLRDHLGISPCPEIPRAHRLGKFQRDATRPIIVYFLDYRDTEHILSNANKLKGLDFNINRDYPKEIVNARKLLWPDYKQLREAYPRSKISIVFPAKLVKDGRVVSDMFPHWNTVMQGNRISTSKTVLINIPTTQPQPDNPMFTNNPPIHHSQTSPRDTCAQSTTLNSINTHYSGLVRSNSSASVNDPSAPHRSRRHESLSPHRVRRHHGHPPITSRVPVSQSASMAQTGQSFLRPWSSQPAPNISNHSKVNNNLANSVINSSQMPQLTSSTSHFVSSVNNIPAQSPNPVISN